MRAIRVFRDDASLSSNPGLWSSIQTALDSSSAFVLLASPTAKESEWVGREVEHWLATQGPARLLIVLTEGDLVWDDATGDFDWKRTALPEALRGVYREVPRYTDLRWARTKKHLSLRDPRFRAAVADVAAPVRDEKKDDLIGLEVEQHRRTMRIAGAAVTGLTVLAVAAAIAAVLAIRGQATARRERDRAQAQARLATARQLAAESATTLRSGGADVALLLAAQAFRFQQTPETRGAVFAALNATPRVERMMRLPAGHTFPMLSADGKTLASVVGHGRVELRPVGGGPGRTLRVGGVPSKLAVSPDGRTVAASDPTGAVTIAGGADDGEKPVHVDGPPAIGEEGPFAGTDIAFARHHPLVAWNGPSVSLWNGRAVRQLAIPQGPWPGTLHLAFSGDDRLLAAASDSIGTVVVWQLGADGTARTPPHEFQAGSGKGFLGFGQGVESIAFSPSRRGLLAVGGFDGTVAFWDAESGTRLSSTPAGSGRMEVAFSPDGRRLLSWDQRQIAIWDAARRRIRSSLPALRWGGPIGFLADSRRLLVGGSGGTATLDPDAPPSPLAHWLPGATRDVDAVAYDPTGHRLATLSYYELRQWDARTLRALDGGRYPGYAIDLVYEHDGQHLVTWSGDREAVSIWNLSKGRRSARVTGHVRAVAATRDGLLVAGTRPDGLYVTRVGADPQLLPSSKGVLPPIGISPDGRTVVATLPPKPGTFLGSSPLTMRTWRLHPHPTVQRASLPGATIGGLGFSDDGRLLATGGDAAGVYIRDAARGTKLDSVPQLTEALAFDRHQRLATLTDNQLELWDVDGRALATQPLAHATESSFDGQPQLAFSPDGRRLATVGLTSRPLVFDVDPRSWPAAACRVAGRSLTRAEWQRFVGPGFPYARTCP